MLKDASEGLGVVVDLVSERRCLIEGIGCNFRGWVRVWKIQKLLAVVGC